MRSDWKLKLRCGFVLFCFVLFFLFYCFSFVLLLLLLLFNRKDSGD